MEALGTRCRSFHPPLGPQAEILRTFATALSVIARGHGRQPLFQIHILHGLLTRGANHVLLLVQTYQEAAFALLDGGTIFFEVIPAFIGQIR
jgi:hypothetical protein